MAKSTKTPAKKAAAKKNGASKPAKAQSPIAEGAIPSDASDDAPSMKILGQYLKDLSFENPNAPQSLGMQQNQPEINISVNVNARALSENDYEIELQLEAKAMHENNVVFDAELLYCGVFRLENIPEDAMHPIILVECPRMIFPFARQILADATRNGGFPPLMLDPIDFAAMYQQRMAAGEGPATT